MVPYWNSMPCPMVVFVPRAALKSRACMRDDVVGVAAWPDIVLFPYL